MVHVRPAKAKRLRKVLGQNASAAPPFRAARRRRGYRGLAPLFLRSDEDGSRRQGAVLGVFRARAGPIASPDQSGCRLNRLLRLAGGG
jgi:hypothetical protein